jgi:replication factor C subunit 1
MGLYRAVSLSGPPGIGKTTSAHLVAKLEGYDILEYNASDTRNEKLLKVYSITSFLISGKLSWRYR